MSAASPSGLRGALLKAAAQYSIGSGVAMLTSIARVAVAGRILPRDLTGVWLGLQLILTYGQNLHFGVIFGMFREIPILRARGDEAQAQRVKRTSLGFVLITCVLGAAAIPFIQSVRATAIPTRYLVATIVLTLLTIIKAYYVALFKCNNRFRELSAAAVAGSVVSVCSLVLIWRFQLDGLIWGMAAQTCTEVVALAAYDGKPELGFEPHLLKGLIAVGGVTFLINIGSSLLFSIDRTVMLQTLGREVTGNYYIGANIITLVPVLVALPAAVLTPRFFERVGRGEALLPLVEAPVRIASRFVASMLGVGALALPAVVSWVWPRLAGGDAAATIATIATFPIVLAGLVTNVFYALNRQLIQLGLLLASALLAYGAAHAALHFSFTLAAVSGGCAAGLFFYYISSTLAAYWVAGAPVARGFTLLGGTLISLLWRAALVGVLQLALPFVPLRSLIARTALAELVFCVLVARSTLRALRELRGR